MRKDARRVIATLAAASALLASTTLHAQTPPPQQQGLVVSPNATPEQIRGRTNGTSVGEALGWIPRVALSPLYLVSEFVIRRPIVAITDWAEKNYAVPWVRRVFNPTPSFHWAPVIRYDLNFSPSFGARFLWEDAFVPRNELSLLAATGGTDIVEAYLLDRYRFGTVHIGIRGDYFDRSDQVFFGLGPRSEQGDRTQFTRLRRTALAVFDWDPSLHFAARIEAGYSNEDTGPGRAPSIETRFQEPSQAPGLGPLSLLMMRWHVAADSRSPGVGQYSGVRLDSRGVLATDTNNTNRQFLVADALLEGAVEVMRPGRVLVGSLYAADSLRLGSEEVPFTYLPELGRVIHYGFRTGRFIGESAIVAQLTYRYPLMAHLEAIWGASVGNVFDRHFQGFEWGLLTASLGVGVQTRFVDQSAFRALVAVGTNRFEENFGIEGVRFFVGVNQGL